MTGELGTILEVAPEFSAAESALVATSLCPVQGKRTMRESDVQIGNSG
jgi:hypothetical protein